MLEKPAIDDYVIQSQVKLQYGLPDSQVDFLPLGYDACTAVYKVKTGDQHTYFLKLRQGNFNPVSVYLPYYLSEMGIDTVIPPIPALSGKLYGLFDKYTMIIYPYIHGNDGYQVNLADHHWKKLGVSFSKIHALHLPGDLIELIPGEVYSPAWRENVTQFQMMVERETFEDPVAVKLASFMKAKGNVISQLVYRTEQLAQSLLGQRREHVLCHSDAHPGNYLITSHGELYLVDWDNPIYAPRERDLMFFGAAMSGDRPGGREEKLFFQGYGPCEFSHELIAYYRYERIIQDIAEFCKQLLLSESGGEDRAQAYTYFTSSFEPHGVLAAAMATDRYTWQGTLH